MLFIFCKQFTSHCWFDSEKCVIGTIEGILFVIENGNLVKTFHKVFPEQCGIYSILLIERVLYFPWLSLFTTYSFITGIHLCW